MNKEQIKFHYGVAFEERLLSGFLYYYRSENVVEYDLKSFTKGDLKGEITPDAAIAKSVDELASLDSVDPILDKYDGGWDDAGGSIIWFEFRNCQKKVVVVEIYDRALLKTNEEMVLFRVIDAFNMLTNRIYDLEKNA